MPDRTDKFAESGEDARKVHCSVDSLPLAMAPVARILRKGSGNIDAAVRGSDQMKFTADERRAEDAARRGYIVPGQARSQNMAAVRRRDTKPEIAVRSALHAAGYRYRIDFPIRLGGRLMRPDIAFTKRRVAVFIDGCFWHGCPIHGGIPATNPSFWQAKLAKNVDRDQKQTQLLLASGWRVVRIWEHDSVRTGVDLVVQALSEAK